MAAKRSEPAAPAATRGVEHALARHRQKYEDEVERLVDATMAVMRESETTDPTVSDILGRAGLSTSAFYRHFPTKDDLLVTLLERAHKVTLTHLAQRLDAVDDPVDRIEMWVRALLDLVRTPNSVAQNRPLLLAHPRMLERFPDELNAGLGALARPLEQAIGKARADAGVPLGAPEIDARLALRQILGILVDAAAVATPLPRNTIDALVAYTLRAVLGTAPEPARRAAAHRSGRA
jgi:AcrR family transcriptional regulator